MATQTFAIMALLNQIRTDHQLVLPDIQRDFVWKADQIRLLMDSIMRGYPFGSLLLWQTRHLEVAYREFVTDYQTGQTFVPRNKPAGTALRMVLDGQQRLQSLYLAVHGSYDGRRLYFNVTSGPGSETKDETGESLGAAYRFEFWKDDDANRPKRLVRVCDIVSWPPQQQSRNIKAVIQDIGLADTEADRAEENMKLLRQIMHESGLVPAEVVDEDAPDAASAKSIDDILEIFVRVNSGGTRLTRSDLMFSLLKSRWSDARMSFDEVLRDLGTKGHTAIDKDFIIRGLLTVVGASPSYEIENIKSHWEEMQAAFPTFCNALRSTLDFCQSAHVGLLSASLLDPLASLFPVIYYLHHHPRGSVPDSQRDVLRAFLYFLLFNRFLSSKSPEARIRYLRAELEKVKGGELPLDTLLRVIATRQKHHHVQTTFEMLNDGPRLALNIAQPRVCRDTLSWQERAEVDHIFPQSLYRSQASELVDDIGNLAYLGKLRNIRKSDQQPWEYFNGLSDQELLEDYLIDRRFLSEKRFVAFVEDRRKRVLERVKRFLGR
ncbi:GmrSD restriction endonuclease domain-containing protein [Sorangium sp. So ce128]|uniref:GmrSD restriction endonuclease domain-containing protein n=1 Tax=Sorangium sp. So ce128 TaxID=3133281 RepID=UPI003F5FAD5C